MDTHRVVSRIGWCPSRGQRLTLFFFFSFFLFGFRAGVETDRVVSVTWAEAHIVFLFSFFLFFFLGLEWRRIGWCPSRGQRLQNAVLKAALARAPRDLRVVAFSQV